jgi:hypothetical protein
MSDTPASDLSSNPTPAPDSAPLNPRKTFSKEKAEKKLTIKKEVRALRKDLNKLRANNADGAAKKAAHALISAKRAEYKTVRKSRFTSPAPPA